MYLGIDESNHGRFPEIFVGVSSNRDKDIEERVLEKIRDKRRQGILAGRKEFRYILVPSDYRKLFDSYHAMIFVVYAELIKAYPQTEHVIIDGENRESERILKGLEFILKNVPQIEFIPKADMIIPIVNAADCIANRLIEYRTSQPKKSKTRYVERIITPDFREYSSIISELF